MKRVVHNLMALPRRVVGGLLRYRTPAYRVQRQADRMVKHWLSAERLSQLSAIPGRASIRKCRLLAFLASEAPPGGCIVEIGSFKGRSAAWLIEAAERRPDRLKVVSIDPHQGGTWDEFCATLAQFKLEQRGLEVQRLLA